MKKAIITAAILLVGVTAYCLPVKSNLEFQKYLAKQIYLNTSFDTNGFEGTIKIKVDFDMNGISTVSVISGINEAFNTQIADIIQQIPAKKVRDYIEAGTTSMIIPVKFVLEDN
jgi:hypothetical protein